MPLLTDGIPDTSWLHGKYNWYESKNKIEAEINTSLPYVAIGSFFTQGEYADEVIEQIHKIWISDGRVTTKTAIKRWANLYLCEY